MFTKRNKIKIRIAAEHILSIITIVHYSNKCPKYKDPIKEFFITHLDQIFAFTDYAPWKAFLGKCLNVICTFIWTYMDVFVMVMSIGVANRFKLLNDDLMRIKGEVCVYKTQYGILRDDSNTRRIRILRLPYHFVSFAAYAARFLVSASHAVSQPVHAMRTCRWRHRENNSCFIFE